jgi:hypothetical protein
MSAFNAGLASGQVARFNMVIPNGCDDGEANCKPVNHRYTQFDNFLAAEVPKIEASPAFGSNGVIIVVYDEDERAGGLAPKNGFGSGGHVVCAIISRLAVPGSYGGPQVLPLQPPVFLLGREPNRLRASRGGRMHRRRTIVMPVSCRWTW